MRLQPSGRVLRTGAAAAVMLGAATVAALAAFCHGPLASAQSPPVERIVPAAQTIAIGDPYAQFDVTVEGVSNLRAYEVLLQYDSTVLAFPAFGDPFVGAENGPFLGSSGRLVTCQPPIVSDVPATTQKRLRFGCNTIGPGPGATGSGVLATIRLKPVGIGSSVLALTASLSDPLGNDIFATAESGAVTVTGGPTSTPTTTNTPCAGGCPTATATSPPATFCTSATSPEVCFQPSSVVGHPGVAMNVDVAVAAVSDLGAVSFEAQYDAGLLEFAGFNAGPFLASSGRTLFCLAPSVDPGAVRQTCVTLGASPNGPSGGGTIGQLVFVPKHNGNGTLHFSEATFLTHDAQPIPANGSVARSDADVTVVDCTSPCATVTPSPTPTLSPTSTATASPTPSATSTPCAGPCPTATHTATPAPFTPTPTPADAAVALDPVAQSASPGVPFGVQVNVAGASNVGAFQFTLRYPAGTVAFIDAQPGAFLGGTGRTVQCNAPVVGDGEATFGCFSYDSAGAKPPHGGGTLAALTLSACGAASAQLDLTDVVLITPGAAALPVSGVTGASVTIAGDGACPTPTPPPATSTPCSTSCPTPSPTATPTDTPTPAPGSPTPTPDDGAALGSVSVSSTEVTPGQQITVDVSVANVADLGAYEFTLSFTPDSPPLMFEYDGVQDAGFLGSTGRSVFCQPPVLTAISVRFGCATSGSAPGPSGGARLARVTLAVTNYGTAHLSLDLFQLTDPFGGSIASHVTGAIVTSAPPPTATPTASPTASGTGTLAATATGTDTPTATATDTQTPTATVTPSPTPTATETASPTPTVTDTSTPASSPTSTETATIGTPTDTPTATDTPVVPAAAGFSFGSRPPALPSGSGDDDPTHGGRVNETTPLYGRIALGLTLLAAAGIASLLAAPRRRWTLACSRLARSARSPLAARLGPAALALVAAGLLVPLVASGSNPPGAVIYKSPGSANLFIGGAPQVFSENVAGADRGIAGFELRLRYDPEFVQATFSVGPLLSTGVRSVTCDTTPLHPGDVVFACTSSGASPASAGPGTLAYITAAPAPGLRIRATKENGIGTVLDDALTGTRLFDDEGEDILVAQVTDANLIVRALEGDVNGDCAVTIIDDQSMALRYPSTLGSLIYDRWHDLEPAIAPDDDIDIKDLQFVFGRNGSNCETPVPPQPSPTPIETPGTPVVVTRTAVATRTSVPRTPTQVSGTRTPARGTPTPQGTTTSATSTPSSQQTPVTVSSATPLPSTGNGTPGATRTGTAAAAISPTHPAGTVGAVSTVSAGSRGPSALPGAGGGGFPGGRAGGLVLGVIAVAIIGAYTLERGRRSRDD